MVKEGEDFALKFLLGQSWCTTAKQDQQEGFDIRLEKTDGTKHLVEVKTKLGAGKRPRLSPRQRELATLLVVIRNFSRFVNNSGDPDVSLIWLERRIEGLKGTARDTSWS
jgi:hypothetical protein